MKWKFSLEFRLSAGPHRVEQSWPTRDAGASQESRHLGAQVRVLPAHRRVGSRSVLWSCDLVYPASLGHVLFEVGRMESKK